MSALPWVRFILELACAFCQLELIVLGFWCLYGLYSEPLDEETLMDPEKDDSLPWHVKVLYAIFFWPTDKFITNRFVEPYFRSKYSIIVLLPLMFVFPCFFWALVVALIVGALTLLGVVA